MNALTLRRVGNSLGVIIPKQELERLRIGEGDRIFAIRTKDGITLTPYDPGFEEKMAAFDEILREDRDAFRRLAK